MEKAAFSIRKFTGLRLSEFESEVGDTDLTEATNVMFDDDGVLVSRPGLALWGVGEIDSETHTLHDAEQNTYCIGRFTSTDYSSLTDRDKSFFVFYSGEGGFRADLTDPENPVYDLGTFWTSGLSTRLAPLTQRDTVTTYQGKGAQYAYDPPVDDVFDEYFITGGGEDAPFQAWRVNDQFEFDVFTVPTDERPVFLSQFLIHKDRGWGFDRSLNVNRVYFSKAGEPETWGVADGGGFIDFGTKNDGIITYMVSFRESLYIFKNNSLWVLHTAGSPTNWVQRKVSSIGCLGYTPVEYQGAIFWVAPTGVYSWDGNSINRLSDPIQNVFRPENPNSDGDGIGVWDGNFAWDEPNHGEYAWSRATVWNDNYIFALQTHSPYSDIPNKKRVFCYHIKHKTWTEWEFASYDDNIELVDMFSAQQKLFIPLDTDGLYFTFKNTEQNVPLVFKMLPDDHTDWKFGFYAEASDSSVTDGVVTIETVLEVQDGHDYSGYTLEWLDGDNVGETATIISNTDGANSSFDIAENESWAPIGSDTFVIYKRFPFTSRIRTKRWNFGSPFSYKRFKRAILDAQIPAGGVTNVVSTANELQVTTELETVDTPSAAAIGQYPISGNMRGQNFMVEIECASVEGAKLRVYGVHVYVGERGRLSKKNETSASI